MSEVRPHGSDKDAAREARRVIQKFFLTGNYVTKTEEEFFDDFTKISEWGKSEQCEFLYIWEEYGTQNGNHHYHAIVQIPNKNKTTCSGFAKRLKADLGLLVQPDTERLGDFKKAVEYRHKLEKRDAFKRFCPNPERDAHFFVGIQLGGLMGDYLANVLELISGKPSSVIRATTTWCETIPPQPPGLVGSRVIITSSGTTAQ